MATTKVNSEFIAVNAISGTIIADGAITSTHLAANCVDSSELVTGSIDTIHIAANQVTATKVVTNAIQTRHIADDQVTADKLANSINTDIATGPAALPKAGGTLTGNLTGKAVTLAPDTAGKLTIRLTTNAANDGRILLRSDTTDKVDIQANGLSYFDGGNVLIGKKADTYSEEGIALRGDPASAAAVATFTRSGANPISLNRLSNDGDMLVFTKDGTIVGSIGTEATDIYIGTTDTGIRFNDAVNGVLPYHTSSGQTDNTVDLGFSSVRWKDLHLAGIASIGNLKIGTDQGTDGQVLTSTGSGVAWEDAAGGGPTHKTFGTNSIMIGDDATGTINAADNNTGVGLDIFASLTSGDRNTTMGTGSMAALTTGNNNVAVGGYALASITDTNGNTALGYQAHQNGSGGEYNVSVGYRAGRELTSGNYNVGIGGYALDANTTGDQNTAVGYQCLTDNTTGTRNTAVGELALTAVTTTDDNTAVGYRALTVGGSSWNVHKNTAVGTQALNAARTGKNAALGYQAGVAMTGGEENVFLGSDAGRETTTGSRNVMIGYRGGRGNTSGSDCIIIGSDASYTTCSGSKNIAIGNNAGYNWTTAYNNTVIGYNARTDEYNSYGAVTIGYNGLGYASEHVTFVNGSNKTYISIGSTSWGGTSDQRLKENIQTSTAGLSFINDLRPVTFDWKKRKDIDNSLEGYEDSEERYIKNNPTNRHGFVAQEVKTVLDNHSEVLSGSEIWSEAKDGTQGISEVALVPMLVKALQEADDKIDALTARVATLEG